MTIIHEGWKILDNAEGKLPASLVNVNLEFSLVVGDDTCKGSRIVQIDLEEFNARRLAPRKILRIARRRLEAYFDGQSDDDLNLFVDCFDDDETDQLSPADEQSLKSELQQIENEFQRKMS